MVVANTSFACCVTRINVVLLLSSFNLAAPTYVHALLNPPKISCNVGATGPFLYNIKLTFLIHIYKDN